MCIRDRPYDVHIYALFTPGSEDLPLMELLNRYASASDRVTWEQTSVTLNPTPVSYTHLDVYKRQAFDLSACGKGAKALPPRAHQCRRFSTVLILFEKRFFH